MAPEVARLADGRDAPGYGPEADIWSCGVCLYKMLSGDHPYKVNFRASCAPSSLRGQDVGGSFLE